MTRALAGARPLIIGIALLALSVTPNWAGASTNVRQLTVYARATQFQYVSHADDRIRGDQTNPFSLDAPLPPPQKGDGSAPAPGDNALFTFKLYSDRKLKKSVGSAAYSCTFNFAKQALCEADFALNDGTMIADGPAAFNTAQFTLAVVSGTGHYLSVRGQVTSASEVAQNVYRLEFLLTSLG